MKVKPGRNYHLFLTLVKLNIFIIPPQTLFVVSILFSRCPSVLASVNNVLVP